MLAFNLIFLDAFEFDSTYSSNTKIINIVGPKAIQTIIFKNIDLVGDHSVYL